MPKTKTLQSTTTTDKVLKSLLETNKAILEKLDGLRPKVVDVPTPEVPPVVTTIEETTVPVPTEYREIVDTILNKNFEVRITPRSDAPLFEFVVIVPPKYSSLSPALSRSMGGDLRVRVLSYAEGNNGVRDYTEKIFNTFSPEVRAQIVMDRA